MKKTILIMLFLTTLFISCAINQGNKILPDGRQKSNIKLEKMIIDRQIEIEQYLQEIKKYFNNNDSSEFEELFKLWAIYNVFTKNRHEFPISSEDLFNQYSFDQKRRFVYLAWLISQKQPEMMSELRTSAVVKKNFIKTFPISMFIKNSKKQNISSKIRNLFYNVQVIGKVVDIGERYLFYSQPSYTSYHTPITIECFEVMGGAIKRKYIKCDLGELEWGRRTIKAAYTPSVGDTILAKITSVTDFHKGIKYSSNACYPFQIKSGIIYKNPKGFSSGTLFGLDKCSVDKYRDIWENNYELIINKLGEEK